ncbi:MAG: histidinol-phosphatase [Actinomycetota bacterium]|nr:MAG: histidinol-phosphatase [Actinomycetota bacterium]
MTAELDLALELADLADSITLPLYEQRSFTLDWKPNRTEVTEADRGAEAAIVASLSRARPEHGVLGEEHGAAGATDSPWRWVVDPIDGTSNFVRGIPVWASLIALTHARLGAVVGVVSAPSLGRRWWGARASGAHGDGRRLRVSTTASLAEAQVCVTFNRGWDALGLTPALVKLQQDAYRARGFGDFWQHMLVAEGAVDVAIDAIGLAPYDLAAVQVIVEEAGGRFTDRLGEATYLHDSAVSSNGVLHDEVLERLGRSGESVGSAEMSP